MCYRRHEVVVMITFLITAIIIMLALGFVSYLSSKRSIERFVKAVVADFETKEGRAAIQEALRQHLAGATKPADAVQRSLANLKEVSAILSVKAPQDAPAFKAWLQTISQNVAEASSEGGFLGIGGVQVSDAEKATLAEISKALGASA